MRTLILSAFLLAAGSTAFAQNLNDVQEKITKQKWSEAKEKLDKADAKTQATSEYMYMKAQVYSALAVASYDSATQAAALQAVQQYYNIEANSKVKPSLLKATLDNHHTAIMIHDNYYLAGIKDLQAQNWQSAYSNMVGSLSTYDLLFKNKVVASSLDTTSVLYAGYAAENVGLKDEAAKYYAVIADMQQGDSSYISLYTFLYHYYNDKKDAANAAKYMEMGKRLYPYSRVWTQLEMNNLGGDKATKLAKLAQMAAANKTDADIWQQYSVDLYQYVYATNPPADYAVRQQELTQALVGLISADPSPYSNFIMAQHLSNALYDMSDSYNKDLQKYNAFKSPKPEDVKKKQQMGKDLDTLNAKIKAMYEDYFKYALAAADLYEKTPNLSNSDKVNYKKSLQHVAEYYSFKKQADKVKLYQDKANAVK
jgi:hypothetical protein